MKDEFTSRHTTDVSRYRIECAKEMTGKVLDVGGGLGVYLPYFGSKDVTVLDISEEALAALDYDNKIVGDACHMPFDDNTFASVWACGVCMYMDIHEFITEAKRVTRKGGKITITVPNPQTPWSRFIKMMGMKIWTDNLSGGGYKLYPITELCEYGELTGEVRFLPPFLDKRIRNVPKVWHTMMLKISV